jgi:predicted RNase H-like HicB family nuclease
MEQDTHKKHIKWPVLITENLETGMFTAILKGMDGVIAQGNSNEEVMEELKISLEAMIKYYAKQNSKDEQSIGNNNVKQDELLLELC